MPRLLIIKPSSLGDIVHGLQVAASLQEQVPALTMDWVARDVFAPLVAQATAVNRVYLFDRDGGGAGFLRLLRELRRTPYDWIFDLQGLLRSALMTVGARGRLKVGRSDAREGAGLFYRRRAALPPGGRDSHAIDILLQFAPVVGAAPEVRGPLRFRSTQDPVQLTQGGGAKPIVLFPDSRRPEKCWPYFPELTEQLLSAAPSRRVVWAGAARQPGREDWPKERFVNLTGRTALEALPEIVGQAALVVGNDSGPMHLAAAMDVPVLALFGPTDPRRFGPYPVGAPGRDVMVAPDGDLRRLSPDVVAARVLELLILL